MMMPGSGFNSATMSKRLVIIGPGYFLGQNTGLQANTISMDSTTGTLTINNINASNSTFIGCTLGWARVNINANGISNLSFIRCWFKTASTNISGIGFDQNATNFNFIQCSFTDFAVDCSSAVTLTGFSFLNCLFYQINSGYYVFNISNDASSGLIQNCVFATPSVIIGNTLKGSWLFNNNISQMPVLLGAGIIYNNNLCTGTQIPSGNGNLQNQTWANIFTLTGSTDARYTLKTGSTAIGAGVGGTNCGIFGGTTPYRLSGIPSVPTIYSLTSPQGTIPAGNTVQINLSTRSNN